MRGKRPLCVGLSLATTWLNGNGWRRADSRVEAMHSRPFYVEIAQAAESAGVDFLFRPDSLFLDRAALAASPGFSSLDPSLLLAAIAHATTHIGLVTTASTSFYPPYIVARQVQSLNWLSDGRAGWNIVTSMDGSGNFGDAPFPSAAERYARATEFVDVVRALWASYPAEAPLHGRDSGIYADTDRVRAINHRGPFLSVEGPLNLPAMPGARIPLFQAGASPEGRAFAARTADGIFAAAPDVDAAADLRNDIRRRAASYGRDPDGVRVMPGLSLFLADSAAEARDLHAETHRGAGELRKVRMIAESVGLDVSALEEDQRITADMLPPWDRPVRSRTHAALLRRVIERDAPTLRDLLARPEVAGSAHWLVVGTAEDAVRAITGWAAAGALDGFIALPGGSPRSLALLLEQVLPGLAAAGLFDAHYAAGSFADRLAGTAA